MCVSPVFTEVFEFWTCVRLVYGVGYIVAGLQGYNGRRKLKPGEKKGSGTRWKASRPESQETQLLQVVVS